jgi:hypothetical protein
MKFVRSGILVVGAACRFSMSENDEEQSFRLLNNIREFLSYKEDYHISCLAGEALLTDRLKNASSSVILLLFDVCLVHIDCDDSLCDVHRILSVNIINRLLCEKRYQSLISLERAVSSVIPSVIASLCCLMAREDNCDQIPLYMKVSFDFMNSMLVFHFRTHEVCFLFFANCLLPTQSTLPGYCNICESAISGCVFGSFKGACVDSFALIVNMVLCHCPSLDLLSSCWCTCSLLLGTTSERTLFSIFPLHLTYFMIDVLSAL